MKTLKVLLVCLSLLVTVHTATAQRAGQNSPLGQGTVLLNGGFGFPDGFTLVDINGEYGVADNVGVGALVKFVTQSGSGTLLGLQGNYHIGQALQINNSKVDPFVGLTLNKATSDGAPVGVGAQLGLRYLFQDKFGLGASYNLYFGDSYSGINHFGIYFTYRLSGK